MVLDPDRDGDGPDASSFPFEVGQYPASIPLLIGFAFEGGEVLSAQSAADEQLHNDVDALAPRQSFDFSKLAL